MHLKPPIKLLRAAQGYLELGMHDDALAELDALSNNESDHPSALEMRLAILMESKRWPEALVTARRLRESLPESAATHIHMAFCLHELGRTNDARSLLVNGPETLHSEPLFYYNLACYDAILGHSNEAVENLSRSFRLDERLRDYAQKDPDLDSIRELLDLK